MRNEAENTVTTSKRITRCACVLCRFGCRDCLTKTPREPLTLEMLKLAIKGVKS